MVCLRQVIKDLCFAFCHIFVSELSVLQVAYVPSRTGPAGANPVHNISPHPILALCVPEMPLFLLHAWLHGNPPSRESTPSSWCSCSRAFFSVGGGGGRHFFGNRFWHWLIGLKALELSRWCDSYQQMCERRSWAVEWAPTYPTFPNEKATQF